VSIRTTFELNSDFLDALVDDKGDLAEMLYNAVAGDPHAADELHRMFGIRIVTQRSIAEPAPVGTQSQ
jgi:hypothetical protein